eukprot:Skav231262  [mRNA]  locus=scaffold2436:51122:57163:+ [translate_table: standard]
MPGHWVGGRGSVACPTKGQYIEAKIFDHDGKDQGTIFIEVVRLFGPSSAGRTFVANFVTATDDYYRHWVTTKDGKETVKGGFYHLCRGDPRTCDGGETGGHTVVHLGKWRSWTEAELLSGEATHLDRVAQNLLTHHMKKSPSQPRGRGELPWSKASLDIGGRKRPVGLEKEGLDEEKPAKRKGEPPAKGDAEKISGLKAQLAKLKAQLEEAEGAAKETTSRKRRRSASKAREKQPPKKAKPFEASKGLLKTPRAVVRKDGDTSDEGGDDDEEEEEEEPTDDDEEVSEETPKKKKKKKKRTGSGLRKTKRKPKVRSVKKKKKKSASPGGRDKAGKKAKKVKDRGPFNMDSTAEWDADTEERREKDSLDSSSDSQDFRSAPSSTSHHQKLVRYARRHPGRLAARMLRKMEAATGFGGGAETKTSQKKDPQPVAHMYYLAVLTPGLRDRWTQRTQRELKVSATLLDLLTLNKGAEAADILAQRMKALEKSVQDNNQWRKAKHLELVDQEDVALVDQGEENMMQKEAEREEKTRGNWSHWKDEQTLKEGTLRIDEVGDTLLRALPSLGTKFGTFRHDLQQGEVKKVEASGPAAHDLLPIPLAGVEAAKVSMNRQERSWAVYCCYTLNFWYCTGWDRSSSVEHEGKLNFGQLRFLEFHLVPAIRRMTEGNPTLPPAEELERTLSMKGQDYEGNTWVVMEELDSEKVIPCWPQKEAAAVQPITRFLTGETKRLIEEPQATIVSFDEWPEQVPQSYVRATDSEWEKLVAEGFKRGLFQPCPEGEVLRGPKGEKILNGAGAVPKEKDGKMLQRFISIFCPLNAVSRKVEGEEGTLPYLGQLCLLQVPDEACLLIDSEDLQSAFNLFEMPPGWRGMFCYQKMVRGSCLGLGHEEMTYVALRTIPMGWISAVGVVQAAIRHLAFSIAKLPLEQELQKGVPIPEGDRFLLYLDSVDQLRQVDKAMKSICEGEASEEHKRFSQACQECGLPRNESKSLAGALRGSIQGGELFGDEGVYMLHPKKMQQNIALYGAFDEILAMVGLLPFAFTNLRAAIDSTLHATDASPVGAGSCTATQFKRQPGVSNPNDLTCRVCRRDITEEISRGEEFECPRKCGRHFCSITCYLEHREGCPNGDMVVPTFSERWSGPNAPLTRAMLRQGFDVLSPFDWERPEHHDFFTDKASAKRCAELDDAGKFFGFEHPYRSWVWYLNVMVALAKRPGVFMAVFSNCCYGGERQKWTSLLTNNRALFEALHKPDCPHSDWNDYAPYYEGSRIVYPTEQEAEYPEGLCQAYARACSEGLDLPDLVQHAFQQERLDQLQRELSTYHKCQDATLRLSLASQVLALENLCVPGQEEAHLRWLLAHGHYRGTDVRLSLEHCGAKHLVPYPAGRWVWRELLSFRWKVDGHINVLEAQAFFAHARRILRDPMKHNCRLLIVVDSQVLYYALGKGRSPSTQLNRLLPSSYKRLDRLLSEYIEHLWMDDHPITYAGHLMSGLRRYLPEARWRVPRARQFFTNWQSTHVSKQAAPLPPEVAMAFAGLAIPTRQLPLACMLLLGFLAFLRTGEMANLHPDKVVVDVHEGRILIALPSTKTSRQREETVCVVDHRLAKLVRVSLIALRGQPFWPQSLHSFRATFKAFCEYFELEEFGFTPYSVRRGGASFAFSEGTSFDELLVRGRWQSNRTARLYLDSGRAELIQTRFSSRQRQLISRSVSSLTAHCEQLR